MRAAGGPQPLRTVKEPSTRKTLSGGHQLNAINRIHVFKALLLFPIGTEPSSSRFRGQRSAPQALEALRRGAGRGCGRSLRPAELRPTYGRGTRGAVQKTPQQRAANTPRGRRGAERTGRGRSERPRGPSFVLPRSARGPSRAGRSRAARRPSAARRGRGLLPAPRWQPPAPAGLAALLSSPLPRALPAGLAAPRDAAPLTLRQARTGSQAAAAAAPPGAAVPRCATPRRQGTIGSARLGSGRGAASSRRGFGTAQRWAGPAGGGARVRIAGGRRAAVPLRCAAGVGAVGGLGARRGAVRRGQPASGVRRWLCGNSRLCRRRCWRSPILRPSGRAWLRPCADGALCRCRLRRSSWAGEEGNAEAALALTRGRRVLRNAFFVSGSFGDRAARVRL